MSESLRQNYYKSQLERRKIKLMSDAITTIKEAEKSLSAAKRDLDFLNRMQLMIQPDKMHPALFNFYKTQWPEYLYAEERETKWENALKDEIDNVGKYIAKVEAWVKHKMTHAVRCALPKKKQRELGMLPSVESEIAMREGRCLR